MGVDDPLGRTGRSRREQHRRHVVGAGFRQSIAVGAELGHLREAPGDAERPRGQGRQTIHGDLRARPSEGAGRGERDRLTDQHVGARPAHGPGEAGDAQARVGYDDDRSDAQAGVDDGGERGPGTHEQRDAVARAHPQAAQPRRQNGDPVVQSAPADRPRRRAGHVDRRDRVVVGTLVEAMPHRHERPGGAGRRLGGRRHERRRLDTPVEPVEHRRRVRPVLGHEVSGAFEAVHVGVGHPVDEIVEIALLEHRVARSPEQQRGNPQLAYTRGDAGELGVTGMRRAHRDVGDEGADAAAALGGEIGGSVPRSHVDRKTGLGQREGRVEEGGRLHGRGGEHAPRSRHPQRCGDRAAVGMMDGGVERDHPGELVGMIDRPPERDHAAPVVPQGHHRSVEADRVGEGAEVGHTLLERAGEVGAVGESHLELVDGDHAPRRFAALGPPHRLVGDAPPVERPRRVAVHREDGADGHGAEIGQPVCGVQMVPRARAARVGEDAGNLEGAPEAVVEPADGGKGGLGARDHQASSIIAVFRPDPTPIRSTRSPRERLRFS